MTPKLFLSTNALTVAVYTALAAHDVACAWRFVQLYQVVEPRTDDLRAHLRAMNEFWREQIAQVSVIDTIRVRSNLIDQIDLEDWVRLFAQHVAPVVVSLDLPCELADTPHLQLSEDSLLATAGAL